METLATMANIPITIKDICDKWLLLTYDIPHNEKGDKARRDFLLKAQSIGAARHTDSVYLMPWTADAEVLALNLAQTGAEVVVWTSNTTDANQAKVITQSYDQNVQPVLDEIGERLDRIVVHLDKKRFKRADKMKVKTAAMLENMEAAIKRRGSAELFTYWSILNRRFATL
jgi:hypothetical protein